MIEIFPEMIRYEVHIKEIFCCGRYFDEIYFFLRKEKNYEFFEKNFSEEHNCYFDSVFASLTIVCYDFLRFSKKNITFHTQCVWKQSYQKIFICAQFVLLIYLKMLMK